MPSCRKRGMESGLGVPEKGGTGLFENSTHGISPPLMRGSTPGLSADPEHIRSFRGGGGPYGKLIIVVVDQ